MKRYVIHPGPIVSKTDGDRHFIDYIQLLDLYGVDRKQCICADWVPSMFWPPGAIHLYPSYHGNYTLPKESIK